MGEPKQTTEYNARTGKFLTTVDYRGSQDLPDQPAELACDFCNRQSRALHRRTVRPFSVEMWPGIRNTFMGGRWNACVPCDYLIEEQLVEALVARAASANPGPPSAGFARLFDAVLAPTDAEEGVQIWTSGRPWKGGL